ncbi:MAG: alpha/beta hydrolase [Candidatus Hodarchaeota archaeon]
MGVKISIFNIIYEIKTKQGIARLHHRTPESPGRPILMLHGFGSSAEVWFKFKDSLGNYFSQKGCDCWALNLSNAVTGDIPTLAYEDLLTSIEFIYSKIKHRILLIGHSMGGIITRMLTSPNFDHPYDLDRVISMLRGVALLTVPNHGAAKGDLSMIEDAINLFRSVFREEYEPVPADLGLGFAQLTPTSSLLKKLNSPLPLNPDLKWLNAVGTFDRVVPLKSALFEPFEVRKLPDFSQQEFPCDHMIYPYHQTIEKISSVARKAIPSDSIDSKIGSLLKVYPAIHTFKDVGEWILQNFLPHLDYDSKFQADFTSRYKSEPH